MTEQSPSTHSAQSPHAHSASSLNKQGTDPSTHQGTCTQTARAATVLIIPAAGSGTRLGLSQPKAFVPLSGATILEHGLGGGLAAGISRVIVAVPQSQIEHAKMLAELSAQHHARANFQPRVHVLAGGKTRTESVSKALAFLDTGMAQDVLHMDSAPHYVLVHDAARCLTPADVFERVLGALESGHQSVVPVVPVVDTVRPVVDPASAHAGSTAGNPEGDTATDLDEVLGQPLERSHLRAVQTPQGFCFTVLRSAHAQLKTAQDPEPTKGQAMSITDDASLVEFQGYSTHAVPGDPAALKITHPMDLKVAQMLLAEQAREADTSAAADNLTDAVLQEGNVRD